MAKNNNTGRILKSTKTAPTLKSASGIWTLDEALQAHRSNSWPQPNLLQPISKSIKLSSAKNTYFTSNNATVGNRNTFTISTWIKRSVSANQKIYSTAVGSGTSTSSFFFMFEATGQLRAGAYNGAWSATRLSNATYNDFGAWYHVMCVVDTTQVSDNIRIYVNGSKITSLAGSADYFQFLATDVNNFTTQYIGATGDPTSFVDGYLAEFYLIDGQALTPAAFGAIGTDGFWNPIPYTGTFGTNGLYLPFTDNSSTQALGYDKSTFTTYDATMDPYRGSVVLHMTGNGTPGGQNTSFLDSGPNNFTVTAVSAPTQGSVTPFPRPQNVAYSTALGASANFNGSTDQLSITSSTAWTFGLKDFTIEFWFNASVLPIAANYATILTQATPTDTQGVWMGLGPLGTLGVLLGDGATWAGGNTGLTTALNAGTWYHFAVSRTNGVFSIFLDGVRVYTLTQSINMTNSNNATVIGGRTGQFFNGFISNVRIVNGTGLYTSAFTPPTAPLPVVPNTQLLLKFDNATIVDSASAVNLYSVTNATVVGAAKYGSAALYFDGAATSAVFATGQNNILVMGSGDFTVEMWMNSQTGNDATRRIITSTLGAFTSGTFCMRHLSGQFLTGNPNYAVSYTFAPNTWYHVAYSRQNTTARFYVNGQLVTSISDNTNYSEAIQYFGGYYTVGPAEFYIGMLDDVRITKGVARYTNPLGFTPPSRAHPEIGAKSVVVKNLNAGVVKKFTTVGSTSWTAPSDVNQIEVLVVGGGGGGGGTGASGSGPRGGGGGGGIVYNAAYSVIPGQTYQVTVGFGGNGGNVSLTTSDQSGFSGGNSVFGTIVASGGGGGSGYLSGVQPIGTAGGSAGGSAYTLSRGLGVGGQGFSGGTAWSSNTTGAGGGGGAGGQGGDAQGQDAGGNGGAGLFFSISGTYTGYSGGGGGGNYPSGTANYGSASAGGGGGGGAGTRTPIAGTANTGGGGGGAGAGVVAGGAGGSGVVILRYTTATNITDNANDSVLDSPTLYGHDYQVGSEVIGSYCTFNTLLSSTYGGNTNTVYSNGALTATRTNAGAAHVAGTMGVNSGQFYYECTVNVIGLSGVEIGVSTPDNNYLGAWASDPARGFWQNFGISSIDASGGFVDNLSFSNLTAYTFTTGDVVGIGISFVDTANPPLVTIYKNGALIFRIYVATLSVAAQTHYMPWIYLGGLNSSVTANFGQQPWAYTPPAGYMAWNTKNLAKPTGAAATPNQHMDVALWTGTGATNAVATASLNFAPGLVWVKGRSDYGNHVISDVIRGPLKTIYANRSDQEEAPIFGGVSAFSSNGFSVGSTNGLVFDNNSNGNTFVGWCWRAGSSVVTNTNGTVVSQVSANTVGGFSIVKYNGNGAASATVGHGLTSAPTFIILKHLADQNYHRVYHRSLFGPNYTLYLSTADQQSIDAETISATSATTFTLTSSGSGQSINYKNSPYIAYCWSEVQGYSRMTRYQGNGLADGPFVFLGFRARYVMIKNITSGYSWTIQDTARQVFNPTATSANHLRAETNDPEYNGPGDACDILSNGIKVRSTGAGLNANGSFYILIAFAESPFGNNNQKAR